MEANNQQEPSAIDEFLPEIFDREAKGYLMDALTIPAVAIQSFSMDEAQARAAVTFVADIFKEVYLQGGLKVLGMIEDHVLYAYALVFAEPNAPQLPVYLHKIFVMEQYRGNGLGRHLMEAMLEEFGSMALFCPADKVSFYASLGFVEQGYSRPKDPKFKLSDHLYSDLVLMTNNADADTAPLFLLNDNDLFGALGLKK